MNSICLRCVDEIERPHAAYCPNCGRNLARLRSHSPSTIELRTTEAEVSSVLSRLREMRSWLVCCQREAVRLGDAAAVELVSRRLVFLLKVERRLERQLASAREVLSLRPTATA